MNKHQIIEKTLDPGLVAVIRAASHEQLYRIIDALQAGGVTGMEVTMTTPDAIAAIAKCKEKFGDGILLGAGSVIDATTAKLVIEAGSQFVVSPIGKEEIIKTCLRYNKVCVAGAYTPTEALTVFEWGADFVKIFPADGLGANYIKALRAPMPQLQIIPTGGVAVETCAEFIKAGCAAVAAGSSLIKAEHLKNQDWQAMTAHAKKFVEAVAAAKKL